MRLLVVEDDIGMAGLLKRGLEEEGYRVEVAATVLKPCGQRRRPNSTRVLRDAGPVGPAQISHHAEPVEAWRSPVGSGLGW